MIFSSFLESLSVLSVSSLIGQIQGEIGKSDIKIFDLNFLNNFFSGTNPANIFLILIIISTILRIFTLWFSCKSSAIIGREITIIDFF